MKLMLWTMTTLLFALGACSSVPTNNTYCDITSPLLLDHQETLDYLLADEPQFVREVLAHNDTHEEICR